MSNRPASSHTPSTASSGSSTSSSLVETPGYRDRNLAHNRIYLRDFSEKLPEHVQSLVDDISKGRQSPQPEVEDIIKDTNLINLTDNDGAEVRVSDYFKKQIFEDPKDTSRLKGLSTTNEYYVMRKEHVPNLNDQEINLNVSQPKPDMLYGYTWKEAFTTSQQTQLMKMRENEYTANNLRLIYPFFVVEFKGDAASSTGSLWVATNQCLGGASTCINMGEKLNNYVQKLKSPAVQPMDTPVFSVAMNGSEARLYVSWKDGDLNYNTQRIKSLLVSDPEHYLQLRRYVRNILDWGKGKRLGEIGAILDAILEESRKRPYGAINGVSGEGDLKRPKRSSASESVQLASD